LAAELFSMANEQNSLSVSYWLLIQQEFKQLHGAIYSMEEQHQFTDIATMVSPQGIPVFLKDTTPA
jgi:hypothetical protein